LRGWRRRWRRWRRYDNWRGGLMRGYEHIEEQKAVVSEYLDKRR
jgi:hypothetical protein